MQKKNKKAILEWSDGAMNIKHRFFSVDIMVYVEGQDDIRFWEIIFQKTCSLKIEVQETGGCNNLARYIDKVNNKEIQAIVAMDSDFRHFDHSTSKIKHPNIIFTRGHSIENTMLKANLIYNLLKNCCRHSRHEEYITNLWFNDLFKKIQPLIILDIYNHIYKKGQKIFNNNGCIDLMKEASPYELCEIKISERKHSILVKLNNNCLQVNTGNSVAPKDSLTYPHGTNINYWLRGHVLASAALRFITSHLDKNKKKTSIANVDFYSLMFTSFENFFNESHEDFKFYNEKIKYISTLFSSASAEVDRG